MFNSTPELNMFVFCPLVFFSLSLFSFLTQTIYRDSIRDLKPLKSTGKIKYYDGWDGNQYTITKLVFNKRLMKVIVRSSVIGGVVLDGLELIDGYIEDGYSFGENFKTELAGAIGANVGASGGAYLGGLVGFEVAGPIGALVLATSGVIVFSWLGEEAAEALAREFFKNNNEEQKK